jgi:hypothetical protein
MAAISRMQRVQARIGTERSSGMKLTRMRVTFRAVRAATSS